MSTKPFQPVREDGRPYWRVLFDHLVSRIDDGSLNVGDIVPHEELSKLLDGIAHHQPTNTAAKHLRERRGRSLQSVRGVGYRLIAGVDQATQGSNQQLRSQRALTKGAEIVRFVDHSLLTPADSQRVTQVGKGLMVLAGFLRMTAERVADHEAEIEMLKSAKAESTARHRATEAEMSDMRRRLDELEQKQTV